MIKIGTDTVEIRRFSEMKNLDHFVNRFFTERERDGFAKHKSPFQHIAGAFAAKEAFSKYLGSGVRGFALNDIEILHDELGKPYLCFKGKCVDADVSISHSELVATAVVCGDMQISGICPELYEKYRKLLPVRCKNMHKGDCGRLFVLAGSVGMTGAACLCTKAALRCGSGLVTLATPECVQPVAASMLLEAMTLPLPCRDGGLSSDAIEAIKEKIKNSDVCAAGPGLGSTDDITEITAAVLGGSTPCVIDADGLNAISKDLNILRHKNCKAVITPHPGEMSRLTGLTVAKIEQNRTKTALDFAKEYDCTVVLKGHETVIASASGEVTINKTGNSGMATGGMGDVLTGVIASFIGQGCSTYNAAVLGVFLHGLAADTATEKVGEFGLIASDVIESLPKAILKIQGL